MNTNKSLLSAAIAGAMGVGAMGVSTSASALAVGNSLDFDPGVYSCIAGVGTPPDNCFYGTNVKTGSFFSMDADGSGSVQPGEKTAIVAKDGIILGSVQGASGSHSGAPFGSANNYSGLAPQQTGTDGNGNPTFVTDGNGNNVLISVTEVPGLDEPWGFFSNTGMHFTTSGITVTSDDGAGNFTLDFSGWRVTWNGIPAINMGGGADATLSCSSAACVAGDTFTLDYAAVVPAGDPSGFGGVPYALHLEGTIGGSPTVIPVPAAVWLFGSGLMGLVGVARRKKGA